MQIHRLFEIVYLLIEHRTMTAGQLAEHFEVSTRTILRDIDVLSGAGIPLYTTRGKGGGISLMDGYVLSKAFFFRKRTNRHPGRAAAAVGNAVPGHAAGDRQA